MPKTSQWVPATYTVSIEGRKCSEIGMSRRARWALEELALAKGNDCTPIDNPVPRFSAYVCKLRSHGVPIETIDERHNGPFAGSHARYVLRASVTRQRKGAAE